MVSVAILGAAGGIGQPLSLLLKLNTAVTRLSLYDLINVPGVAADVSHINTDSAVEYYIGQDQLNAALEGIDIVIIPAGVPRRPGMTRDDLFNINASIVRGLVEAIAESCPHAIIGVISNPVNSTVPIAAEVLKEKGVYDPKRLFGITTLDVVRASRFIRDIRPEIDTTTLRVPVVGGHSGNTIVPLISLAEPKIELSQKETEDVTHRIQFGGDEVVKAKDGAGSATLSMACAAARFADSVIRSFGGAAVIEPAFVPLAADSSGAESIRKLGAGDLEFFAVPVLLGKEGTSKILPIAGVSAYEAGAIKTAAAELKKNIDKGVHYTKNS
ncbi:putative MDH1-malate dehydrogenase precursor, mitochondrial [Martensiomyces pterosporus]|nr:putative MDH1-malate dehydrogenase precursor, mitochondrial [Martensiomyces pterosporus]